MLLRPAAGPTVTAAEVRAPAQELHCGRTADLTGLLITDGRGGQVTYRRPRSDGHDSGELIHTAARSGRTVTVHLCRAAGIVGAGHPPGVPGAACSAQMTLPSSV